MERNPSRRPAVEEESRMDDPRVRLLLIVTGSSLRAEEVDRPLAYYLKQQIEQHLAATPPDPDSDAAPLAVRVVADFRWLNDEDWQGLPTISLGGPGVNALAHRWLEDVPVTLAVDEQYYIQMDPDLDDLRVSIWGMDNATTQVAVSAFAQRYLPRYLERCQADAPDPSDLENDD
jgi:hypothetical protein